MQAQSKGHHEIPVWTLNSFSPDQGKKKRVWLGTISTREIKLSNVKATFVRNRANTTTSFQSRGDGTFQRIRSDRHEATLAEFDSAASDIARTLIKWARQVRDRDVINPIFSEEQLELCKRLITVQSRRTRESQDRAGFGSDKSQLYLDLYQGRARQLGEGPFTDQELLEAESALGLFDVFSQNTRAGFASGDHPILVHKEREFLADLGLVIAVVDPTAGDFVIGSHGTTIIDEREGRTSWLPIAPDVAISLEDRSAGIRAGVYPQEFVEKHNRAALSDSARVVARSKTTIERAFATLPPE